MEKISNLGVCDNFNPPILSTIHFSICSSTIHSLPIIPSKSFSQPRYNNHHVGPTTKNTTQKKHAPPNNNNNTTQQQQQQQQHAPPPCIQAVEELYCLMQLMSSMDESMSDEDRDVVIQFRRNTLQLYLHELDGRIHWQTLIALVPRLAS